MQGPRNLEVKEETRLALRGVCSEGGGLRLKELQGASGSYLQGASGSLGKSQMEG